MPLRVSKDARASWGIQVNFAFSAPGFSRRLIKRPITKGDLRSEPHGGPWCFDRGQANQPRLPVYPVLPGFILKVSIRRTESQLLFFQGTVINLAWTIGLSTDCYGHLLHIDSIIIVLYTQKKVDFSVWITILWNKEQSDRQSSMAAVNKYDILWSGLSLFATCITRRFSCSF